MKQRLMRVGGAAAVVAVGIVAVASSGDEQSTSTSVEGLDELVVRDEATAGYERSFFEHWVDADGDGCDTRAEVLMAESVVEVDKTRSCRVRAGEWKSMYDGSVITDASDVDIDHVVPLAEAWRSGAWDWDGPRRRAYANDVKNAETLVAVSASSNRSKGDKDPDSWLPDKNRCQYVASWVAVKREWDLTVDAAELTALRSVAGSC